MKKNDGKKNLRVLAARNIAFELSNVFNGIRFSVKTNSFSDRNEIEICWENGPKIKNIAKIVEKYKKYFDCISLRRDG